VFTLSISGIPVALSFPHFLNGDPQLLEKMDGLSPDPSKHESIFVIQPVREVYSLQRTYKMAKTKRLLNGRGSIPLKWCMSS
jgi:hypothetical protein